MHQKITLFPTLLLSLLFIMPSCKYSDHYKTYQYANEWQINYPPYMKKATVVYPGSEFQASNGYRDTYAFMRELISGLETEALKDSLKNQLQANLEDPAIESDSIYHLNGTEFHTYQITGLLNDKRMYYLMSVVNSKDERYHFTAWMFNTKRDLWEEDYNTMLHSWRRLD